MNQALTGHATEEQHVAVGRCPASKTSSGLPNGRKMVPPRQDVPRTSRRRPDLVGKRRPHRAPDKAGSQRSPRAKPLLHSGIWLDAGINHEADEGSQRSLRCAEVLDTPRPVSADQGMMQISWTREPTTSFSISLLAPERPDSAVWNPTAIRRRNTGGLFSCNLPIAQPETKDQSDDAALRMPLEAAKRGRLTMERLRRAAMQISAANPRSPGISAFAPSGSNPATCAYGSPKATDLNQTMLDSRRTSSKSGAPKTMCYTS